MKNYLINRTQLIELSSVKSHAWLELCVVTCGYEKSRMYICKWMDSSSQNIGVF